MPASLLLAAMLGLLAPWGTHIDTPSLYFYRWNSGMNVGSDNLHVDFMLNWESGRMRVYRKTEAGFTARLGTEEPWFVLLEGN